MLAGSISAPTPSPEGLANGQYPENRHLDSDYPVDNDPALEAAGRDQELEKAVDVLLAKLPRR